MMNQKQHEQAYEVVKRVSQYFPANPKRLTEVLRLAIINGKYEDVEKYYAVFVNIDEREETLIKYICAALVVCGKYYLGIKAKTRALELFQKAAATGYGRSKILKEIVQVLVDFNMAKEAKIYLEKFPFDARKSAEYLLMDFLVLDMTSHPGVTIDVGRKLITQGIFDERLYSVLIQRHYDAKLNSAADDLIYDAIKKFPKHKEIFEKMRLAS